MHSSSLLAHQTCWYMKLKVQHKLALTNNAYSAHSAALGVLSWLSLRCNFSDLLFHEDMKTAVSQETNPRKETRLLCRLCIELAKGHSINYGFI